LLVAHLPWAQGVVGSNPIAPTNLFKHINFISVFRLQCCGQFCRQCLLSHFSHAISVRSLNESREDIEIISSNIFAAIFQAIHLVRKQAIGGSIPLETIEIDPASERIEKRSSASGRDNLLSQEVQRNAAKET
jgi:hypothetical protein